MIDLEKNTISLDLFKKILKEIKNSHEIENLKKEDIIDSFSNNQFESKGKLIKLINELNILDSNSTVAIFGCWFGSILVPVLSPKVKRIIAVDQDKNAIRLGQNRFFKEYNNVLWDNSDVFEKYLDDYSRTTLFINTSCEHMPPMKTWPWWDQVQPGTCFAFQSNNMSQIEGHVNCVQSLREFKTQLPPGSTVLFEDELTDQRGSRYTLIGKIR